MKAETVFCSEKDADEREENFSRQEMIMREAERLYDAGKNYRFAPMEVKKQYLFLYYNLLKKYGDELTGRGLFDPMSLEYRQISLYQDAGGSFLQLYDGLRVLACGR